MENPLPKEIWCKIWGELDFETLQKTCVLVCHEWFENIRENPGLSGKEVLVENSFETSLTESQALFNHP